MLKFRVGAPDLVQGVGLVDRQLKLTGGEQRQQLTDLCRGGGATALGSGTDVAISAADMILLRDDLGVIQEAIRLARATLATIRRNLAWAFSYNVAAIPLAAAGFLNPLIAGAAMAASSALVVASSIRLRRFGDPRPTGRGRRPAPDPAETGGEPEMEVVSCPG